MKNYFFGTLLCAAFVLSSYSNAAKAQAAPPLALTTNSAINSLPEEDLATSGSNVAKAGYLPINEVSTKAIRSLSSTYKNAGAANWSAVKGAYLAEFDLSGRRSRALFSRNGYMIYGITYGGEQDLPKEERYVLKSNYVDYDITSVAEVQANGKRYWICTLQDANNIVVTRSAEGALEELQHMVKKQEPRGKKGKVIIPD